MRHWPIATLLLAATLIAGCAGRQREPLPRDAAIFGAEFAPAALPGDLEPFRAGTWIYLDPDEGTPVEHIRTRGEAGRWRIDRGADRSLRIALSQDGSVLIVHSIDRPHQAITHYDPPLLLIPAPHAGPGPHEQQVRVEVRDVNNPDRLIDHGEATWIVTHESDQIVTVPIGRHRAHRITRTLDLSLVMATVRETTTGWYVPDLGLVAEQRDEEVKVFGPLGWRTRQSILLERIEEPGQE